MSDRREENCLTKKKKGKKGFLLRGVTFKVKPCPAGRGLQKEEDRGMGVRLNKSKVGISPRRQLRKKNLGPGKGV